jgi:hypothetical protein
LGGDRLAVARVRTATVARDVRLSKPSDALKGLAVSCWQLAVSSWLFAVTAWAKTTPTENVFAVTYGVPTAALPIECRRLKGRSSY